MQRLRPAVLALLVAALLALAILGVLRQSNPLTTFPSLDSGYYLYIGQQLATGKTAYVDIWESKPPGIFYVNALGLWLARGTRWGVWLMEFASLSAAAAISFHAIRKIHGFSPALFATFTWLWGLAAVLDGGNLTEEYSLPFNFLAVLAFWLSLQGDAKWPDFLIGLTFAASFAFRANNTGVQVAIVLAWVLSAIFEKQYKLLFRRLVWSGVGVLLGLGLLSAYFLVKGTFGDMINAALFYNFAITRGSADLLFTLRDGLDRIGIPAGFALLGFLLVVIQTVEKRRADAWVLFLLVLWPLETVLCSLSGRGYDHYFIPWMVALGLLSATLIGSLSPPLSRFVERRTVSTLSFILLLGLFLSRDGLAEYGQSFRRLIFERQAGIEMDHPVAAYLREKSKPDDYVLIWGARLAFNYLSRRETPSAYLFYPLLVDVPFSQHMADQFYADLTAKKPVLIVDAALINQDLVPALDPSIRKEQFKSGQLWPTLPGNVDAVLTFIDENYSLVDTVSGYPIYKLK